MYEELKGNHQVVNWRKVMFNILAKHRAMYTLWMACHNSLEIKERLYQFGMLANIECCFCGATKTLQHLIFECNTTNQIWQFVLKWIGAPFPYQMEIGIGVDSYAM